MRSFPVRLPSLDLVRGFVAVGRRMSMTLAARDLFITQSAVSRQIIALEAALGARLINRGHRSISFTAEGERFFRIADGALHELQDAVNALATGSERAPVTITASIGVSGLWLMPRLGGFHERHPDIDLRVAANNKVLDLRAQGADIAIRYCAAANAPPGSLRLFGEAVAPVAHPSLGVRRLDADVVANHVLIEYDDANIPWLQWADRLHSMGLSARQAEGRPALQPVRPGDPGGARRPGSSPRPHRSDRAPFVRRAARRRRRRGPGRRARIRLLAHSGGGSAARRRSGGRRLDQGGGAERRIAAQGEAGEPLRPSRIASEGEAGPVYSPPLFAARS